VTTTLLDAEAYPAAELATLYGGRWHIETDLRSIKCDMKMDVLRCKTPEMVEKEVWIHLLGYNLIRRTMVRAAAEAGLAPREVSFKGALQTMTAFQDALRWTEKEERRRLWEALLAAIGGHRVGNRPGRVEPRAIKRRPKPHKILTVPRREARKRLLEAA
jgi:Transposase DDE domain